MFASASLMVTLLPVVSGLYFGLRRLMASRRTALLSGQLLQKTNLAARRNDRDAIVRFHLVLQKVEQKRARPRPALAGQMEVVYKEEDQLSAIGVAVRGRGHSCGFSFASGL